MNVDDKGASANLAAGGGVEELRERVRVLEATEEGAREAFGLVVQEKSDALAECARLRELLDAAYAQIRIIARDSAGGTVTSARSAEKAPSLCTYERICATQGFCSRSGQPISPMGNLGGDGGCPHGHEADLSTHTDDAAVDEFAERLKDKLAKARAKGRSGWRDPAWSAADINRQMHEHAVKGDPMDVAAYAMFLALRGEATTGPQTAHGNRGTPDESKRS